MENDKILDGKELSKKIRSEIKERVNTIKEVQIPGKEITLAIIQVGNDLASSTYVKNKTKACAEVGIECIDYHLSDNIETSDIIDLIQQLNVTKNITGILVQLPLPKHLDKEQIIKTIDPKKDVDCFTAENIGKVYGDENARFLSCTPAGIIQILKRNNIEIEGKNCVIVGRSHIVGRPIAELLLQENATVTICHSYTKDLRKITKRADILISAIGKPKFFNNKDVKTGAVLIDVGINRDEEGKLCGDFDFDKVYEKCSKITPVPGGVGPMTITMLLNNVVEAHVYNHTSSI